VAYAPAPESSTARKLVPLVTGILLVGGGVGLTIRAEVGVAPYDVLTTGLADLTGVAIGIAAVLVPVMFVTLGLVLGGRIGPGTAITVVSVGPVVAAALWLLPEIDDLPLRAGFFAVGASCVALGITSVVVADLGPGPAEVLMLAITEKGFPLAPVRTGIEVVSVGVGWAMGGKVGVGTVIFAFLIGPVLRRLLDLAGYRGARVDTALPAGAGP
jgi:uncharacterized membrane protein YczE